MTEGRGVSRSTVKVHLADAPTDVLVWLVEQPPQEWHSVGRIASHVAPAEAGAAEATVANALAMLRTMGYVVRSSEIPAWAATVEGQRAVETARKARP